LKDLKTLIHESKVLHDCPLLQELGIVDGVATLKKTDLKPVKDFLLNFVITQHFLGRQTLIQNARSQFPDVDESKIDQLIEQLCQENQIQILDDRAKKNAQLICLVPKAS
jgi:ABC-type thiamine transport system substrate-binding protein